MKPRHLIMALGVVGAGWLALFGDKTPNSGVAEAVVTPKDRMTKPVTQSTHTVQATPTNIAVEAVPAKNGDAENIPHAGKTKREPLILALHARKELIGGASAASKDSLLFGSQSWVPAPPLPPKPVTPPPPAAPTLPFTYIGKKLEDAMWEVYLTEGEHTIIVREKSTIEQTYRVESIKPPTMTLTYLPLNQMQTLSIGGDE